ncbi:MAG: glycosyltransferase [Candidatus Latescibacteria bacterium]|nr:glycosyltransferase [Candidatus Latescibacterota bacterium]
MTKKLVSVIIPSRNNKSILLKTLNSLSRQTIPPEQYEVIVVDDGSTDGTEESISQVNPPFELRYYYQEFKGQSAASNLGIKKARGHFTLLTCSDIIAKENLLEEHLRTHNRFKEDIVVLGYIPYSPEIKVTPFMEFLITDGPLFAYQLIEDKDDVPPLFLYAPNVSVKTKRLIEVGMFDEEFKYGAQDSDLGIRLRLRGLRMVYNEKAIGYHYHPTNVNAFCYRQKMAGKAAFLLASKHPKISSIYDLKNRVLKDYLGKGKIIERAFQIVHCLENMSQDYLYSLTIDSTVQGKIKVTVPLIIFLYKLITDYYFAEGINEEISKMEGENWHYDFKYPWEIESCFKQNEKLLKMLVEIQNRIELTRERLGQTFCSLYQN